MPNTEEIPRAKESAKSILRLREEIFTTERNILAGTRTSFAVQLLKDELNKQEQLEKNKDFLQLVRFLEEEGAVYMENYPIALNLFTYETGEEYFSGAQTPNDKVIQTIIDNNLVETFLRKTYIVANQPEHYEFHVILRAISALKAKGIDVPVDVEYADTIRLNLLKGKNTTSCQNPSEFPKEWTSMPSSQSLSTRIPASYES